MTKDIRKVIRKNRSKISNDELVGTKLRHPEYGEGRITDYCECCGQAKIKFDGREKQITRHFDSIFVENSKFLLSDKQLELKFGHLRSEAAPQSPKFPCHTPPLPTPSRAKAVKARMMKRTPLEFVVKAPVRVRVEGKRPPGAKPLFQISG